MGERGLFVREAKTYYRIYEDNFVGLGSEVKKELEVKKKHYATMAKYNPIYLTLFNQICSIDVESISDYSRKTTFWWNKIILQ